MNIAALFAARAPQDGRFAMPYVIAEVGVNHEGDMDLARGLIDEAAAGGADAVKFQTYKAETLASRHSPAYWDLSQEPTTSQYALFKKHDAFWKDEFEALKAHCDRVGIEFLSTPFDLASAEFLAPLVPAFKISSSDITNRPFIERLCAYGKPVLLSTGASFLYEIEEAVSWIRPSGVPLALLHCVLNYPTADENAHLGMIAGLRDAFPGLPIGYSDHTLPRDMRALGAAALLGAVILEKHFTHDKTLPGNDHYHAMDMADLKVLRANLARDALLYGTRAKHSLPAERPARENARRSLVASRAIPAGTRLAPDMLTWKRPASGISPKLLDAVVGLAAGRDIAEDEVLAWDMLESGM